MLSIKDLSIRKKLIVIQFVTAFSLLLFYSLFVVIKDHHSYRHALESNLELLARITAARITPALTDSNAVEARRILTSLSTEEHVVNAWLYNNDQHLVARYSAPDFQNVQLERPLNQKVKFGTSFTIYTYRVIQNGRILGTLTLRLRMEPYMAALRQNLLIVFIILILGVFISLSLAKVTQQLIADPLRHLIKSSRIVIEEENYSVRVEKEGRDEVGQLCDTFNLMMDQLEKRSSQRDAAEASLKENNARLEAEIAERKRAESELARHKENLEELVAQRTLELTGANKALKTEIASRQEAVDRLSKSDETYRLVVEQTGQLVYDVNFETGDMRWIGAVKEITGYSMEEILEHDENFWKNRIHKDDAPKIEKHMEATVRTGGRFSLNYRFIRKDGREIAIRHNGVVLTSEGGLPYRVLGTMEDVTDRMRIQDELKRSEKNLRSVFDNMQDAFYRTDAEGFVIWCSPSTARLLGYERPEDIIGHELAETFYANPRDRADYLELLDKGNTVTDYEVLLRKQDGSTLQISANASYYYHDDGTVAGEEGTFRDITRRKAAEDRLATRLRYEAGLAACSATLLSETVTEDALNTALAILLHTSDSGRIYMLEKFVEDGHFFGRRTHEVCARGVKTLMDHPDFTVIPFDDELEHWRDDFAAGRPIRCDLTQLPPEVAAIMKEQGIVSMLAIPIRVDGDWWGILGIDNVDADKDWIEEDVRAIQTSSEMIGTYLEKQKFDAMLRVSEERFRNLVENANDIICSLTPEAKINYLSPKFTDILGYDTERFIGEDFHVLLHPDDTSRAMQWMRNEMQHNDEKRTFEVRFLHQDGSTRWFIGNLTVLKNDDGEIREMVAIVHDFTDMRQILVDLEEANRHLRDTQAQLVQSAKMASLGQLVAGIAHEINTPIGAVNSMQDTLFRGIDKLEKSFRAKYNLPEDQPSEFDPVIDLIQNARKVIKSGTERVIAIVKRLRSFARLDEAELKTVDIHEGLEDTLTLIHHEVKHNIEIKRDYGKVPPIACYPGRLNQVFLNILVNAKQAIEGKGTIAIKTALDGDKVLISFTDSGSGMTKEQQAHIFDPGFTTKGVGVGTGLGLSICYQIIEDHKGEITVESRVGRGTTFTIMLPLELKA